MRGRRPFGNLALTLLAVLTLGLPACTRMGFRTSSGDSQLPTADLGDGTTPVTDLGDGTTPVADDGVPDASGADAGDAGAPADQGTPGICETSTLNVHDVLGDGSTIVTYLFDHDFKSLVQVTASYGVYDALESGGASIGAGIFSGAAVLGGGAALALDGLPLPTGATPRAFSLWITVEQLQGTQAILTYGDAASATGGFFSLHLSALGEIGLDLGGTLLKSGSFLAAQRWYHLALSYDGSAIQFYVNGVRVANDTVALNTSTSDSHGKKLGSYDGSQSLLGRVDQLRIFDRGLSAAEAAQLAAECMYSDPLEGQTFTTLAYSEDFGSNLTAWNTWGTPKPRIIDDAEAENGKAFDTNGDANYHSGADSNFSLAYDQAFAVEYRAKQPQDTTISNKWLYVDLGLTHTISSANGSGPTIFVLVSGIRDTNKWELFNPFGLDFYAAGNAHSYWDYWNDFAYHVYRIEHLFQGGKSYLRFYVDGVLFEQMRRDEATTDPWYITLQGRSYGAVDNHVDWVRVYTP